MTPYEFAAVYHHETKHHYDRYARSLGYLDWAAQPDPFRRFHGATLWPLRFSRNDTSPSHDDLFAPGTVPSQPVTLGTISEFFEFSLALSAWKQYQGSRWALRINPSSGNLHPTEGYLVIGPMTGLSDSLSKEHVEWQLIDAVADACTKPTTEPPTIMKIESWGPPLPPNRPPASARKIIRQRRSAIAFDGITSITAEQFYLMLDRVLPRPDRIPWNALGPPVCVHLGLFVHRVIGLSPGLYFLVRDPVKLAELRAATDPRFEWTRPDGCPESLPLYLLAQGDVRQIAGRLSCGQDIAAESAFSLGMIAEFEEPLKRSGAWFYLRLFWETGVIGQTLYLESEAAGVRATGIGCFFDDPVHELFGLQGTNYQSLYHFTVGGPIEDARLTTLPPYPMEMRAASG